VFVIFVAVRQASPQSFFGAALAFILRRRWNWKKLASRPSAKQHWRFLDLVLVIAGSEDI
jgi:hypothetical protein